MEQPDSMAVRKFRSLFQQREESNGRRRYELIADNGGSVRFHNTAAEIFYSDGWAERGPLKDNGIPRRGTADCAYSLSECVYSHKPALLKITAQRISPEILLTA